MRKYVRRARSAVARSGSSEVGAGTARADACLRAVQGQGFRVFHRPLQHGILRILLEKPKPAQEAGAESENLTREKKEAVRKGTAEKEGSA